MVCPTASSYLQTANVSDGAVAEMAAIRKTSKYHELAGECITEPLALESLGSMGSDTRDVLVDLGRVLAVVVCLSVRPFVTSRCILKRLN